MHVFLYRSVSAQLREDDCLLLRVDCSVFMHIVHTRKASTVLQNGLELLMDKKKVVERMRVVLVEEGGIALEVGGGGDEVDGVGGGDEVDGPVEEGNVAIEVGGDGDEVGGGGDGPQDEAMPRYRDESMTAFIHSYF